jgi:phosphoribosylformimino-5-aminoimidazole carboxamide ribonucleotide (ProFAR) isomerase
MDSQSEKNIVTKNTESDVKSMDIIPAINLFKGVPVIKMTEAYETLQDSDGNDRSILEVMDELKGQYDKLFITDIHGILKDKPQLELLRSISNKMELWVDAGSRSRDGAIDVLVTGAGKVVLSTKTLGNLKELERAVELSENVLLSIDYDNGIVSPKKDIREMSPHDLLEEAESLGLEEIIFTDLKNLASGTNFSIDIGRALINNNLRIYFHGKFRDGTKMLQNLNLAGVITEVETFL